MSEIREVENLQVSFDRPGEGVSLASGAPRRWRPRARTVLALVVAAVIVVAADRMAVPLAIPANGLDPARRTGTTTEPDRAGPLDGEYHRTVTFAELRNQGSSVADARSNAGAYTLTLHGGQFHLRAVCRDAVVDDDGRYQMTATRLTFTAHTGQPIRVAWSRQGANLTFTSADGRTPPPGWTGGPWIRAAGTEDQRNTR